MQLLAVGDSFTYGEELEDRSKSWPTLLGNSIGYFTTNLGAPGASNDKIVRETVDYIANNPGVTDLVVIGWSSPGRTEFSDQCGNFDIWPGYPGDYSKGRSQWRTELVKYISVYHNESSLSSRTFRHIILLQSFLKTQHIPYVMADVSTFDFYRNTSCCDEYDRLIDKKFYIDYGFAGMREWTANVSVGQHGHFLEEGHRIVANKFFEKMQIEGMLK